MNKFLKCFIIFILNLLVIISFLGTGRVIQAVIFYRNYIDLVFWYPGYHAIKFKRLIASNNSTKNSLNIFDNHLTKSEIFSENDFNLIITRKAFTGGMDIGGEVLYICRVRVNNTIIPGKYSLQLNKCAVTHNSKERKFNKYQLLVDSGYGSYEWRKVRPPVKTMPSNIVLGGLNSDGQFYYICQCRVQSHRIKRISEQIGKVHFDQSMKQWIATVPFSGQEIQCYDYSVLIMVWIIH